VPHCWARSEAEVEEPGALPESLENHTSMSDDSGDDGDDEVLAEC